MAWYSDLTLVNVVVRSANQRIVRGANNDYGTAIDRPVLSGVLALGIVTVALLAASLPTGLLTQDAPAAAPPAVESEVPEQPEPEEEPTSPLQPGEVAEEEPDQPAAQGPAPGEADEAEGDLLHSPWMIFLVTILVVVVPIGLGSTISKRLRMPDYFGKISLVLFCAFAGVMVTGMGWPPKLGIDLSGGVILVYEVLEAVDAGPQEGPDADDDQAAAGGRADVDMDKLIGAISRRVNPGGVKEVTIRQRGASEIEIIQPEVDETEVARLKRIITSVGTLEFRILANDRDHKSTIEEARQSDARASYVRDSSGNIELDRNGKRKLRWAWIPVARAKEGSFPYSEIATRKVEREGTEFLEILVVGDPFNVDGGYLENSRSEIDQSARPCVSFSFNSRGARLFAGLTSNNLPDEVQDFSRKLGIVLDGYLHSAPAIRSTIREHGQITGDFTRAEVDELVSVLNAGSLPAKLSKTPISEMVTGPTLGLDTIRKGSIAIAVSMGLVLLFMLFYYRFAGIVACMALLMNLAMILGIMITISAAFTLPGIAALVLTVGIAVDANVLIFERIREELDRKATLRMAIRNGFGRATSAIVDANLTTLITATVLYVIGTDQVKGFAVTLWLGVVLSMFTAIFCSRVVFDIAEKQKWITKLKMMRLLGKTNIDFLAKRRVAAVVSIAVITLGLVSVVSRGKGLLDIDFTGGASIEIVFTEPQNIGDIRDTLSELPDLAVSNVQLANEAPNLRFMINTSSPPDKDGDAYLQEVKDRIAGVFGKKLAHYTLAVAETMPIVAGEEDGAAPGKGPGEAGAGDQSRRDLPAGTLLASSDPSAVLLAQAEAPAPPEAADAPAEPVKKSEAKEPTEKPKTDAPPKSQEKPKAADRFAGGTWADLDFEHAVNHETLVGMFDEAFASGKFPAVEFELSNPKHTADDDKAFETWEVRIKLPEEQARTLLAAIQDRLERTPVFPSSSSIGGKVAASMQVDAIVALLASLVFIVGYIWVRFQRVMFGLAAVVALVHDVLITLGVIALSAYVADYLGFLLIYEFKIGLPVLAAFLTIIGYSLNDTIVVFDRIREVKGKSPHLTEQIVNTSINQTLSRTLLTSLTTLLVVVILYVGGGQGIHAFAFSLVIGVLVGTYSSIFVAAPVLVWMSRAPASTPS